MIVTFIILGILVAVVSVITVIVVGHDSPRARPYCQGYDSRFPQ
jgi:hypothetical protein